MFGFGEMNYFLGLEVHQFKHRIFLNQEKYAQKVLKKKNCMRTNVEPKKTRMQEAFECSLTQSGS